MKIGLVRHGSTAWNKEKRAQGSANIPLDVDGVKDAEKLAIRLKDDEWDLLYSSPLLRAKQTAERIADQNNLPIIEDLRLVEVSGGKIEGTTEEERVRKWGKDWRTMDLGIEKPEVVLERIQSFLQELSENHKGKQVLIITHGGSIRYMLKHLLPADTEEITHFDNTSLTELTWDENKWVCSRMNCTLHLNKQSGSV